MAYRTVNLVILGLLLYAALFPLISPPMEKLLPAIWRCQYKALTGNPCFFCGLTEDMRNFLAGTNQLPSNSYFPLMLRIYGAELILRILLTTVWIRFHWKKLPAVDIAIHSAGFAWMHLLALTT